MSKAEEEEMVTGVVRLVGREMDWGVNWKSGRYRYSKYTACMYEILNKYILKYTFS